jgi:trimethylamine--corrinoid protein Co-methyltransferase
LQMKNDHIFKPSLQVLNPQQIQKLHLATARVLEHTGVMVTHAKAREIFTGGGARVEGDRVRIPRAMLEDAIEKAPSRIVLGNRRGEEAVILEDGASWFGVTLDDIYYLDPETSQRRQLTLDDCRRIVTLYDGLPNFTWGMTFGAITDVPAPLADRYAARQALTYSEKPVVCSSNNAENLKDIYEMAKVIVADGQAFSAAPPLASFVTTISPLILPDHVLEQMMFCTDRGLPQVVYNGIQTGSTAPMSFSGAVVQGNAETLAGLIFIQLLKPGSPVIFGSCATVMDMRSTIFSFGAPEMSLMTAAQCQIARQYRIPFYGTAGCSDSKLPDAQAAAEAVFSCFSSALSGASLVHDAGLLEYATMVSPEQIVLVNEVLSMVNHYMRGLDVSDEALALEVIDAVGPGEHYLILEHTMNHFREAWYSQLFDRNGYSRWSENGSTDLQTRVRERTLTLMAHQPAPFDEKITHELDAMSKHWIYSTPAKGPNMLVKTSIPQIQILFRSRF